MDLSVGAIYRSDTYGRYIEIVALEDRVDKVELTIHWIDKDTKEYERGHLVLDKSDTKSWVKVDRV